MLFNKSMCAGAVLGITQSADSADANFALSIKQSYQSVDKNANFNCAALGLCRTIL